LGRKRAACAQIAKNRPQSRRYRAGVARVDRGASRSVDHVWGDALLSVPPYKQGSQVRALHRPHNERPGNGAFSFVWLRQLPAAQRPERQVLDRLGGPAPRAYSARITTPSAAAAVISRYVPARTRMPRTDRLRRGVPSGKRRGRRRRDDRMVRPLDRACHRDSAHRAVLRGRTADAEGRRLQKRMVAHCEVPPSTRNAQRRAAEARLFYLSDCAAH
jgi:hypothetical protein